MVDDPAKYFARSPPRAATASRSTTKRSTTSPRRSRAAREQELQVGVAFNPETEPEDVAAVAGGRRPRALHGDPPGYSGQPFQEETYDRVAAAARGAARTRSTSRSTAASTSRQHRSGSTTTARRCSSPRSAIFGREDLPRAYRRLVQSARVSLGARCELARAARGRAYPKPTVGAVVVAGDGEIVGEGATEAGGRHAEVVALDAAGDRARGATLYVTLEPCAHHGTTPPCTDAILAAGIARVVFGARDPNPEAAGGDGAPARRGRRGRGRRLRSRRAR